MAFSKILKFNSTNFRNLFNGTISFSPNINCIFGANGSGKTNLLEAIYFLINRKSFRKKTKFPQMLSMDGESLEIFMAGIFQDGEGEKELHCSGKIYANAQNWYKDGTANKGKPDVKTIFIDPFDSYLFHTKASFRRSWLDSIISYMDKEYKKVLSQFNQSLRFRNTLLSKKPREYREQINAIDHQIAKQSKQITDRRLLFLEDLSARCKGAFYDLFSEKNSLELTLSSDFLGLSELEIYEQLQNNLVKDEILGYTRKGIQVDDYVFHFNGINSFDFCSLGQQKMSYLSLNFAYIELFRYNLSSYPIILIDDVSGELDSDRWHRLIDYLQRKEFQVFITTANSAFKLELEKIANAKWFYVVEGEIAEGN